MKFKFRYILILLLISGALFSSCGATNTNVVVAVETSRSNGIISGYHVKKIDSLIAVNSDVDDEVKEWSSQIREKVLDNINKQSRKENADKLYYELLPVLYGRLEQLSEMLQDPDNVSNDEISELRSCYNNVLALYKMRIALLHEISFSLYLRVTGAGVNGVKELRNELKAIVLHYQYRRIIIPLELRQHLEYVKLAPLPFIRHCIILGVIIFLFCVWRRWAKIFIPQFRLMVLDIKPRTKRYIRIARFLWYWERVRTPIEFMVLWWIFFKLIDISWMGDLEHRLWIIIFWVLMAQFFIKWVNAIIERGNSTIFSDNTGLRLKTLRLVVGWLLLLGLGLDFTAAYAGKGTLYEWVWRLFQWLLLPVLLIIVVWWREDILSHLKNEPKQTALIKKLTSRKKGFKSYLYAFVGGLYLLWLGLIRYLHNMISSMEWGRQLLAIYYRYEVNRENEKNKSQGEYKDIPDDLREKIITNDNKIINKVAAREIKALKALFSTGKSGRTIIIGDRGSGKSTLLRRLKKDVGEGMIVVDCQRGGEKELLESFGFAILGKSGIVDIDEIKKALCASSITVVAVDNIHNLSRPMVGGQKVLDTLYEVSEDSRQGVRWVFTCNYSSWSYISRVREHKLIKDETIFIKDWQEDAIAELINNNNEDMGIVPDFSKLFFPRRLDEKGEVTLEERNKNGFMRVLFNESEGNPAIALRMWAESLKVSDAGDVVVQFVPAPDISVLEGVSITMFLILRVILQCDYASELDIMNSLRLNRTRVSGALCFGIEQGWIETTGDGYYRITWKWYRAITRILNRKNILKRIKA